MGNGKLKRDEDLCMATCFENYGFLSLTQNDTNYKFIKNNLEQNGWKKIETTWLKFEQEIQLIIVIFFLFEPFLLACFAIGLGILFLFSLCCPSVFIKHYVFGIGLDLANLFNADGS